MKRKLIPARSAVVRVPMAVWRVPVEERRGYAGDQTTMGLHSQDGRNIAQVVAERHVSNARATDNDDNSQRRFVNNATNTGGTLCRSVFAPSCVSHTVLTRKDWKNIKIDAVSLPLALHCWQTETRLAKMNKQTTGRLHGGGSNRAGGRTATHAARTMDDKRHRATARAEEENATSNGKRRKIRRNNRRGQLIAGCYYYYNSPFKNNP